jgi:L-arabinose transport system permease protein
MQFVRGAAYLVAPGGTSIGISDETFIKVGTWDLMGVRAPIWYMAGAFILFGILLNRTVFGRNALAIGGNMESARLAGIQVARTRILIFALQGLVAAFAGIVLASRVSSGQPQAQVGLELQVISACVLGGVSLTGGVASMTGVVGGVLIMGVVQNSMSLRSIDTYWQMVVSGVVLLAAVLLDRLKAARR